MPSSFFVNNGGTTAARSTIADDLTASSNSKSDAQKLAINAEDAQFTLSDGTTTGNSALHYSAKAAASATSASGSASTATQQAGLANDAKLDAQTAKAEAVVAFGDSVQLTGDQTIAGAKSFTSNVDVTESGAAALNVGRNSSDGDMAKFFKDGSAVGSIGVNNGDNLTVQGNSAHSGIEFGTNAIYPHKNSANVDNTIDLGEGSLRWKDLYLSGGVVFDAVAGNATSNTLDEYEEGTWTPLLKFGGANVGMTGTFIGKYIKVGSLLTVSGQITITAKGSSTGNVLVTGLPFTTGTTAVMSFTNYHLSYNSMIWGQIYANQFSMYEATTGGTRTNLDDTNFSTDTSLSFSATYPLT